MTKRELYIVWNSARNEAVIVDVEDDAMVAAGSLEPFSGCSSLCERFNELYAEPDANDDKREIQTIKI